MTESVQPVAGSLEAVVLRACRYAGCAWYLRTDCPHHSARENLGVVASFDNRVEDSGR